MLTKQRNILSSLSKFSYLTRIQFAKLGIDKYNSALSKYLNPLVKAAYIGQIDALHYGLGYIYYLTSKGAKVHSKMINVDVDSLFFQKQRPKLSAQSVFHRTHAIDCQIEIERYCLVSNDQIAFYHRDIDNIDFKGSPNKLHRSTSIPILNSRSLEPDAIFCLNTLKGSKLFCFEYEENDYTKKSFEKVLKHLEALNMKSPSAKYGHAKAHRTLFVYKSTELMNLVMKRLDKAVPNINSWFLFKPYSELVPESKFIKSKLDEKEKIDFKAGWLQANGERVSLY